MPSIVPVEKHPFRRDDLAALLVGTLPDTKAPTASDATLDRLPRQPGPHVLPGLSSRGLVWAPLRR